MQTRNRVCLCGTNSVFAAHWPFREHSETMEGGAGKRSKNQRARTGTNSLQAHTRPDETLEVADEGGQVGRSIELVFGDG